MSLLQLAMKANPVVGYVCMALLAVQFGLQPIVTQKFMSPSTDTTLVVMLGELLKAAIAFSLMCMTSGFSRVVRGACTCIVHVLKFSKRSLATGKKKRHCCIGAVFEIITVLMANAVNFGL